MKSVIFIFWGCLLFMFSCKTDTTSEAGATMTTAPESTTTTTTTTTSPKSTGPLFERTPMNEEVRKILIEKVEGLEYPSTRKQLLLNIQIDDQKIRNEEMKVIETSGYGSEAHKKVAQKMWEVDNRNLLQVETYIKKFGHPSIADVEDSACSTPCLVITHARDKEVLVRNYLILKQAYEYKYLDSGFYAMYLQRLHEMEFGKKLQLKSPFREADEIAALEVAIEKTMKMPNKK